jgi:hypothetical protein
LTPAAHSRRLAKCDSFGFHAEETIRILNGQSAIVLVIDRVGAGYLGPYGNTWVETPELNRMASESLLIEHAISDSPLVDRVYRSYWFGTHALHDRAAASGEPSLPAALGATPSTLLTDCSQLVSLEAGRDFGQRILLATAHTPGRAVSTAADPAAGLGETQLGLAETELGQSFAGMIEWVSRAAPPYLMWFHSRGMSGNWDAPFAMRDQYRDEEDPETPAFVQPPDRLLGRDFDPDELLGILHAYAGQVSLLDACLGALLDVLTDMRPQDQPLLIVTSPRGFALGEHGRIGACGDQLRGEVLHVPLLIRLPGAQHAGQRLQMLSQPGDLYATLRHWFGNPLASPVDGSRSLIDAAADLWGRECVCSVGCGQQSIRTPGWFLCEGEGGVSLYAKPDDRWEINEVSSRCPAIVEELSMLLQHFRTFVNSSGLAGMPAASPICRNGMA